MSAEEKHKEGSGNWLLVQWGSMIECGDRSNLDGAHLGSWEDVDAFVADLLEFAAEIYGVHP